LRHSFHSWREPWADEDVERLLLESRVDQNAAKPSVEGLFHAYLLSLPGVSFVGHVHAIAVNQILCSPRAEDYATKRAFPDEIVCCGTESVLVPYTDPGVHLARAIAAGVKEYMERHGEAPRIILLQNHGIIGLGGSPAGVMASLMMAEKAAKIFVGAAALGGPVFLTPRMSPASRALRRTLPPQGAQALTKKKAIRLKTEDF